MNNELPVETLSFTQFIDSLHNGMVSDELNEALQEVVKAVRETRKEGNVQINIKLKLNGTVSEDQLKVTPVVSHKAPRHDTPPAVIFSTADGSVTRDDPKQIALELKQIQESPAVSAMPLREETK